MASSVHSTFSEESSDRRHRSLMASSVHSTFSEESSDRRHQRPKSTHDLGRVLADIPHALIERASEAGVVLFHGEISPTV
jgi:hypothetical protein